MTFDEWYRDNEAYLVAQPFTNYVAAATWKAAQAAVDWHEGAMMTTETQDAGARREPRTNAALAKTIDSCGYLSTEVHGALADCCRELEDELERLHDTLKRQDVAHHREVQEQVAAERERCAMEVWYTLQRYDAERNDDDGVEHWLREAERSVRERV